MDFNIDRYRCKISLDKPIEYKGLVFYPVLTEEYEQFYDYIDILQIDKDMQGPNISSLSYMEFVILLIQIEGEEATKDLSYVDMFRGILELTLRSNLKLSFRQDKDERLFLDIAYNDSSGNFNYISLDKYDFDNIIKIICYQNIPDYDDEYIDPELKQALNEEQEMLRRKSVATSLEDRVVAITVSTGILPDEIYKMTLRKFMLTYYKCVERLDYQILKTAEMSGNVEFKEPVKEWVPFRYKLDVAQRIGEYSGLQSKVGTK